MSTRARVSEVIWTVSAWTSSSRCRPRACDECKPFLLLQHPDLLDVQVPEKFVDEAHVWRWLAEQVDRFGATRELTPIPAEDHTQIDPIAELRMMRPDAPIIAVEMDGEAS